VFRSLSSSLRRYLKKQNVSEPAHLSVAPDKFLCRDRLYAVTQDRNSGKNFSLKYCLVISWKQHLFSSLSVADNACFVLKHVLVVLRDKLD
jgi:hypothetical protein